MVLTKLGILVRRFRIVSYPRGETTREELLSTRFFCSVAYLVLSPPMPKPPSSSTLPPQSGKTSFLRAAHILAKNLELYTSGWSVSKFPVFGSVRFGEFRFRFGSVSKPTITFGFRLVNFGFRLTVSISRKKLRQNPTFFKQSQKVLKG